MTVDKIMLSVSLTHSYMRPPQTVYLVHYSMEYIIEM